MTGAVVLDEPEHVVQCEVAVRRLFGPTQVISDEKAPDPGSILVLDEYLLEPLGFPVIESLSAMKDELRIRCFARFLFEAGERLWL
jgi:hypothetical protein